MWEKSKQFQPKIAMLIIIALCVSFFSVNSDYSKEKEFSVFQAQDTVILSQLSPLPYGVKYHVTKAWLSQGIKYLIIAGGRVNDTITRLVIKVRLTPPQSFVYLPMLPAPIEKAGGFIIKDSLYIVGGSSDFTTTYRNSVYKIDLNNPISWQQKGNMLYALSEITYGTADVNDTVIYVAGGKKNGDTIVNSLLRYNTITDNWSSSTVMPFSRYGIGLSVVTDSTILLVGGLPIGGVSNSRLGLINKFNPNIITWSLGPLYPPGDVYNVGCWGNKKGLAYYSGGANAAFGKLLLDSVYPNVVEYNGGGSGGLITVLIKPSPVTHTQLDGFIDPGITQDTFRTYTAGGALTPSGPGTNMLTSLTAVRLRVGITPISTEVPENFVLHQNYPNPFNPSTKILFEIPVMKNGQRTSFTTLKIYDITGKEIAVLLEESLIPGTYEVTFDGYNVPSGIYYYRLVTGNLEKPGQIYSNTRKMVLLK